MRVLCITAMYPEQNRPSFGAFVARLNRTFAELAAEGEIDLQIDVLRRADGARGLSSYVRQLLSAFKRRRPYDVIHVHYMGSAAWIGALVYPTTPLLISAHGSDIATAQSAGHRLALRLLGRRAAGLHFVSEDLRAVASAFGLSHELTLVHPIGVDTQRFKPVPPASADSSAPVNIVMVGNPVSYKGWAEAVDALLILRQAGVDARLLAVGPAPASVYAQQAKRCGVGDSSEWLGSCGEAELIRTLARGSLLWAPSHREGFGLAPLEGMASGLPVVATGVGGMAEFMVHEDNALVVPPRDPASLAQGTLRLLRDKPLRQRLAAAGPPTAARFDIRDTARALFSLYGDMVRRHRPGHVLGRRFTGG